MQAVYVEYYGMQIENWRSHFLFICKNNFQKTDKYRKNYAFPLVKCI